MTSDDPRMKPLEWSEALCVGHPDIDAEHRRFVGFLNDFTRVLAGGLDRQSLILFASHMVLDKKVHFVHEERILLDFGYDKALEHARMHRELEDELDNHYRMFLRAADLSLDDILDVCLNIRKALLDHLLYGDLQYKSHILARQGR